MSLCKLHSIHSLGPRPLIWTCIPRVKFTVITKASGGRSTTRKERNQSSRPEDDSDGVNPLWDSNVEGVRWRNRNRSDARESTSTPDWLTPKKEWTFNPQETGEDPKEEEQETKSEVELPWWRFSKANYDYDDGETEVEDTDDDEEDDEDDDGFDMKSILQEQVLSSLRWGIPISFVVLPWLLGNPLIILLGLALVPAVQKLVGPAVKELWRAFLDLSGSSAPKRRRKAGKKYDFEEREDAYSSWSGERDNPKPYRYKRSASYDSSPAEPLPYSDVESNVNRPVSRQDVSMGGWEDLEADRRGMMPVRRPRRSSKLGWKRRKKEKPLIVRLLVALFPFLRNWGGWLSIFMVFPFLGVLEGNYFR